MKTKILVVPFMIHLVDFFSGLQESKKVEVFAFSRNSKLAKQYTYGKVVPLHTNILPSDNISHLLSGIGSSVQLPSLICSFSKIASSKNIDLLIVFDFYHWYALQAFSYKKKNPEVALTIYSETKRWPRNWLSRLVMHWFLSYVRSNIHLVDNVLVYTEDGKRWWQEQVPEARISILPAPVDATTFVPAVDKQWLKDGTLRILMNARYSAYKKHEDLLAAVAQLLCTQNQKVQLTFIGRDDGGRNRVEALVAKYELTGSVTFLDPLPTHEMPALYQQHDILVLPSYNEAIGMVVPEAMACGIPTITSDTVGANIYVVTNQTGLIYKTGDISALASALRNCCSATTLATWGAAARERIMKRFTPAQVTKQFIDLLELS